MDLFNYGSLGSQLIGNMFRVFDLEPGLGSHAIVGTLRYAKLRDGTSYEALSYCWVILRTRFPSLATMEIFSLGRISTPHYVAFAMQRRHGLSGLMPYASTRPISKNAAVKWVL